MTTNEVLMDIANRLPADATLADAAHELELRAAIAAPAGAWGAFGLQERGVKLEERPPFGNAVAARWG